MSDRTECDLLIVGGGPAGLTAAINGASEGLDIVLVDSGPELGGQAARSALIENYPGFPEGISGEELTARFTTQASKFRSNIICPETAVSLRKEGDWRVVSMDDESVVAAKVVILSPGLSYRRLAARNVGQFLSPGGGVNYGAPTSDPRAMGKCTICIVGGANSAGQAAMHLAKNESATIKILVRKKIADKMSHYLVERLAIAANIEVMEGVEVTEVAGDLSLKEVVVYREETGTTERIPADHLFIFIGAAPKTFWLNGTVAMDERKFIITGPKLVDVGQWDKDEHKRLPLSFETSVPGVFACGDVRLGSTKRITSAVGEGSVALQMCHDYLRIIQNGS